MSFITALSGALVPGPLLTYTIIRTAKAHKAGYLIGLWVIIGHGLIELLIIIFLCSGFAFVLQNIIIVRMIGVIGGLTLICFGLAIARDIYLGKMTIEFTEKNDTFINNPILGGMIVSMSNPYWWVWWASIGLSFMLQFKISLQEPAGMAAFFLGHTAGDLVWYLLVSILTFFGLRRLNQKVYHFILAFCSLFMAGFGLWLILNLMGSKL